MRCPKCGATISKKLNFCTFCGSPLHVPVMDNNDSAAKNTQQIQQSSANRPQNLNNNSAVKNNPQSYNPGQSVNQQSMGGNNMSAHQNIHRPDRFNGQTHQEDHQKINNGGINYKPGPPIGQPDTQPKKSKTGLIVTIIIISVIAVAGITVAVLWAMGLFGEVGSNTKTEGTADPTVNIQVGTLPPIETEAPTEAPIPMVKVPDVVGLSKNDAVDKLSDSGLKYSIKETDSSSVQNGFVVSQSPVAGKEIESGDTVTIYISVKKESPTTPPDNKTYLYCRASEFATLRSGPSRSSSEIVKIKSREKVELLGSDGEFYHVSFNGKKGYVLKDFFSENKDAPLNYGSGNP